MTGFPLDPSKAVKFSFSITISSGVKSLFQRPRKRFSIYNPAAYALANSCSLFVSKSKTRTFSN